jgi:hypothetical protein
LWLGVTEWQRSRQGMPIAIAGVRALVVVCATGRNCRASLYRCRSGGT